MKKMSVGFPMFWNVKVLLTDISFSVSGMYYESWKH